MSGTTHPSKRSPQAIAPQSFCWSSAFHRPPPSDETTPTSEASQNDSAKRQWIFTANNHKYILAFFAFSVSVNLLINHSLKMPSFHFLVAVLAWFTYLNTSAVAANVNTTSVPFRIMALGASVTFGVGSTTGDSYRKDLEDLLTSNGNTVQYVGLQNNGNFTDNAVEATPGFVISQIAASANTAVRLHSKEHIHFWSWQPRQ